MANTKKSPVPLYIRMANVLTTTLLRIGVKLIGVGNCPMYLFTVRGRKSGQPRTTPIAIVEQDGKRYLFAPFGVVDWVRNLRVAREAILTRGRRAEEVHAIEQPKNVAGLALKRLIESGNPIGAHFGVAAGSPQEDFERATISHPVFLLERK